MANDIRIRMYRPGFGDCFLLSFGDDHVLIDFGAHMHGEIGTMDAIMDDIEAETNKKLALVVASHAHRDHISGFGKFAARFAGFDVKQVWLPWTDDPSDPDATKLRTKQLAIYDRLDQHFRLSPPAGAEDKRRAAAVNALSNLRGNEAATSALARGLGTGKAKYLQAGQKISKVAGVVGLSAEILGPPKDTAFLGRMNPPADQRYLTEAGDLSSTVHPFAAALEVEPKGVVDGQPTVPPKDLSRLHEFAESPADALALTLDSARNNTSLVILFRYGGKALLFPGDAQWGSWQSWIGTGRELIGELDFLKIAHHGSENATPVDVVAALRAQGLAAMVSTQVEPFPTIPRMPLIQAIEAHHTTVVRSDWIKVTGAKSGPKVPAQLPGGFATGTVWIDYSC